MTMRLANGESGSLVTPLTTQTLTYVGGAGTLPSDIYPDYTGGHYAVNPLSLRTGILAVDSTLYNHNANVGAQHGLTNVATHAHTGGADGAAIAHSSLTGMTSGNPHTQYIRASGLTTFTGTQSMGGFALTNVLDPVDAQDAATKNYVVNAISGISLAAYTQRAVAEPIAALWQFNGGAVFGATGYSHIRIDSGDIWVVGDALSSRELSINRYSDTMVPATGHARDLGIYNGTGVKLIDVQSGSTAALSRIYTYARVYHVGGSIEYSDPSVNSIILNIGSTVAFASVIRTLYFYGTCDGNGALWFTCSQLIGKELVSMEVSRHTWPGQWADVSAITSKTLNELTGQIVIDIGGSSPWDVYITVRYR